MMKMVYNDEYNIIDSNMSDSNIGARKDKNIRNHIFILNGIINDAIKNKKCVDIQILDYRQCFDQGAQNTRPCDRWSEPNASSQGAQSA